MTSFSKKHPAKTDKDPKHTGLENVCVFPFSTFSLVFPFQFSTVYMPEITWKTAQVGDPSLFPKLQTFFFSPLPTWVEMIII